ncbi:hypothetical protein BH09PSE5_BH09PSE5_49340 [soil metagenome]
MFCAPFAAGSTQHQHDDVTKAAGHGHVHEEEASDDAEASAVLPAHGHAHADADMDAIPNADAAVDTNIDADAPSPPQAGDHTAHHSSTSTSDKCNLCGDLCSMTPMWSEHPSVPFAQTLLALIYPDFRTPAPIFSSDGQERPPRTS